MKKDGIIIILVLILCVVCFFGGRLSIKCDDCREIETQIRYIEKKIEIKKLEDEIENVNVSTDVGYRDSLRAIYNPK